jgi:hypothetical protein
MYHWVRLQTEPRDLGHQTEVRGVRVSVCTVVLRCVILVVVGQ